MKEFIWNPPYIQTKVKEVTILKPSDEQLRVTEMVRNVERKKEFYNRLNLHNAEIVEIEPIVKNDNFYHNELRMNEVVKDND